ncbi:hypothetical protein [uncultured Lamprocystis sp.]|jgi:hypothetical protein|uniref:hypothetical protein n=1 Tax=uncultured Lamprocystis sp. TaxID=543132 RepID=UPI0025D47606|nr:hypothetical protein [uncultured Lamprocystis sp.]
MTDGKRFNWAALDRHLIELGWSLQRLADASRSNTPAGPSLNERNLRKIRDGEQQPRVGTVKRISDLLAAQGVQVRADDLWVFPDQPSPSPAVPTFNGNRPATNPFDPWAIALPPVFVGRTGALRDLEWAARDGRGVSLLGEWRIGKTSLLHTWGQRAQELGFVVRLLSGQGRERQGHQAFVDAVVDAVSADPRTAATGATTGAAGEPARPQSPDAAADRLGNWCSVQQQTRDGLPPLLLLDEAEGFLGHCEPGFLERLRGLLTKRRLALVFATRRTLPEVYADLGRVSPFANMLEALRIELLEPGAAAALLARGAAGLAPDDPAWFDWAGRHPFYLTLLARRLFNARADGADPDGGDPRARALARFRDEAAQQFALWWSPSATANGCAAPPLGGRRPTRTAATTP